MALNFPDSPSVNDVYDDSTTGFSYQWDGTIWKTYVANSLSFDENDYVKSAEAGNINSTGIVTATSFDGSLTGDVTGNLIGNVYSSGISTFANGNVLVGGATTTLVVTGDTRITGILSIGQGTISIDGSNNVVNVGTALTLGHTQGVQFHTQNLHSQGFEVNQINASGIVTASSFVKTSGTSSQFLKADGSVDSSTYITSADGGNADQLDGQEGTYYLDYNNFTNTPTIPTNNNELTNGAGYITTSFTNTNQLTNGAGFITSSDNISGTSGGLSGSPSITVTDITAVGNVSIAGTLTYEDVTSVDSVGLVTARTGVRVTTGGIEVSAGGAAITGVVTATSFVGDITGNADTATTLETARNFSASGDATASSVSFNGSGNVDLALTLANSGVTAATYGSSSAIPSITVDAKGRITSATTNAIDSTSVSNGTASVSVASNGPITSTGNHDFTAGIDVTGNITVSGTVDGRDVATDGTKLDGIESGATADQTAAEILTAIKTVDGAGSGLDADNLDGYTWGSSGKDVRATEFYADNWFRNYNANEGLYNEATGAHWYSSADGYWELTGNTQNQSTNLRFRGTYNGNTEGWIHASGNGWFGFLNAGGEWALRQYNPDGYSPNLWFIENGNETWTGNPGTDVGKIEYHSNRFYIASGSNSTYVCQFRRSGTDVCRVENNGTVYSSGDFNSASDIKLKTNIKTISNSLDKVLQLRGVEYDRIDMDGKHQIGVIAQEVEKVVPDLVNEGDEGIKSVSYGNITALLIEAIKEQQKQIDTLTKRIEELGG